MSQEIIYTSAPRGLKLGSKGFCTVASTRNMVKPLADRLESLSGYRHVFTPGDPQNPVNYSHVTFTIARQRYHVLSRIADAGYDYSQRSNKLAHHVVLTPDELPPQGPAWLLSHPGYMETEWNDDPHYLDAERTVPAGDCSPAVCKTWQDVTDDAGWGGVLAQAIMENRRDELYLICTQGTKALDLICEAQSILPADHRWMTTFSTYFTKIPPSIDCRWRCVMDGTDEAENARRMRHIRVVDLTKDLGPIPNGPAVDAARTGQRIPDQRSKDLAITRPTECIETAPLNVTELPSGEAGHDPPPRTVGASARLDGTLPLRQLPPALRSRKTEGKLPSSREKVFLKSRAGFIAMLSALIVFVFLLGFVIGNRERRESILALLSSAEAPRDSRDSKQASSDVTSVESDQTQNTVERKSETSSSESISDEPRPEALAAKSISSTIAEKGTIKGDVLTEDDKDALEASHKGSKQAANGQHAKRAKQDAKTSRRKGKQADKNPPPQNEEQVALRSTTTLPTSPNVTYGTIGNRDFDLQLLLPNFKLKEVAETSRKWIVEHERTSTKVATIEVVEGKLRLTWDDRVGQISEAAKFFEKGALVVKCYDSNATLVRFEESQPLPVKIWLRSVNESEKFNYELSNKIPYGAKSIRIVKLRAKDTKKKIEIFENEVDRSRSPPSEIVFTVYEGKRFPVGIRVTTLELNNGCLQIVASVAWKKDFEDFGIEHSEILEQGNILANEEARLNKDIADLQERLGKAKEPEKKRELDNKLGLLHQRIRDINNAKPELERASNLRSKLFGNRVSIELELCFWHEGYSIPVVEKDISEKR